MKANLSNRNPSIFFPPKTNIWQPVGFLILAIIFGILFTRLPLVWSFILLVGGALVILILIYPLLGLSLALLVGPFGALESIRFGVSILDTGQIILLFTLVVWFGRRLLRRGVWIPHTFLNYPLAIFLFITSFTLLNAPSIETGLKEMLKWIEIGLIILMVVDEFSVKMEGISLTRIRFSSGKKGYVILTMLLASGVIQACIGIWQFGLRGQGPDTFLVLDRFYRAYGTFEQPNPFGGYMNLSVLLAGGIFITLLVGLWRGRFRHKAMHLSFSITLSRLIVVLLLVGGTVLVTGLGLLFSWSRGAWLGFAVGTAALVLFLPEKWGKGTPLFIVAMLFMGVVLMVGAQYNLIPSSIVERISDLGQGLTFGDVRGVDINPGNYAILERVAHWQAALDMARDNIWLGVGFGNYEQAYAQYALINWPFPLGHAHNYYLNLLAETGVLGSVSYFIFWVAVIWQTMRLLKKLDGIDRGIALGLLGVWFAISIHHMVDKLYVNNIYIHLGVMFGLLQILDPERTSKDDFVTLRRL